MFYHVFLDTTTGQYHFMPVFFQPIQEPVYEVPVTDKFEAQITQPLPVTEPMQLPEVKEESSNTSTKSEPGTPKSERNTPESDPKTPSSRKEEKSPKKKEQKSPTKGVKRKRDDKCDPERDDKCHPNPRINLPIFEVGQEIVVMEEGKHKWKKGIIIYRYGHMYKVKMKKTNEKIWLSPQDIWDHKRPGSLKHPKIEED